MKVKASLSLVHEWKIMKGYKETPAIRASRGGAVISTFWVDSSGYKMGCGVSREETVTASIARDGQGLGLEGKDDFRRQDDVQERTAENLGTEKKGVEQFPPFI